MNGFGLHVIPMVGLVLLSWLGQRSLDMERRALLAAPGWPSGCTFPEVELPGGQSSQAVYFPVQLHKLIARMRTDLHFTEATQEKGNYKHNSESETNSPYIVVGTYENECRPNTSYGATLPDTPSLAVAYEQGLLDGNLGQMVSFHSTYKSTLRIEVPVWPDVRQAVPPTQTKPPLTKQEDDSGALDRANKVEEETEEVEDDKYVPPDGQGCFSFRQSLLLRAKDTLCSSFHWQQV